LSDVPLAPPPPRLVVATRRAERRIVDGFEYVRVRDLGEMSILRRGGRAENQPAQ
jgi:hypothetical protein